MKRKVYLETSIISYLTARPSKTIVGAAHQQITAAWWEAREQYELFVSESVIRECSAGDPEAARKRLDLLETIPTLRINEEVLQLAKSLLEQEIVPTKAGEDAIHIATATVYHVDCLVTWNCRHIANHDVQTKMALYLDQRGLYMPFICTPEELLGEDYED